MRVTYRRHKGDDGARATRIRGSGALELSWVAAVGASRVREGTVRLWGERTKLVAPYLVSAALVLVLLLVALCSANG